MCAQPGPCRQPGQGEHKAAQHKCCDKWGSNKCAGVHPSSAWLPVCAPHSGTQLEPLGCALQNNQQAHLLLQLGRPLGLLLHFLAHPVKLSLQKRSEQGKGDRVWSPGAACIPALPSGFGGACFSAALKGRRPAPLQPHPLHSLSPRSMPTCSDATRSCAVAEAARVYRCCAGTKMMSLATASQAAEYSAGEKIGQERQKGEHQARNCMAACMLLERAGGISWESASAPKPWQLEHNPKESLPCRTSWHVSWPCPLNTPTPQHHQPSSRLPGRPRSPCVMALRTNSASERSSWLATASSSSSNCGRQNTPACRGAISTGDAAS